MVSTPKFTAPLPPDGRNYRDPFPPRPTGPKMPPAGRSTAHVDAGKSPATQSGSLEPETTGKQHGVTAGRDRHRAMDELRAIAEQTMRRWPDRRDDE